MRHRQNGYTEQRNDSRLGQNGADGSRFNHTLQNGAQFKIYELFTFGIFRLTFSDHSRPLVTEAKSQIRGTIALSEQIPAFLRLTTQGILFHKYC